MHPLNYTFKDFSKIMEKEVRISYSNYNEIIIEEGKLIGVNSTNSIEIKPSSIILERKGATKLTISIFEIESIAIIQTN